ncbi:MAG: YHS domain-containing (seleno)protein [Alphaproteobacteria bacterium]|nr:YHS domain-containing (seleno)protein [Alphaproteobacteria bacterium]
MRKIFIAAIALIMFTGASQAFEPVNTGYFSNVTLDGYDTTAYFEKGQPHEGHKKFSHTYNGAEWHFLSKEDRDLFAKNPENYAPQFGGYCSNQMSLGNLSDVDPHVWLIHKGKLYLFGHDVGLERWKREGIDKMISDATRHYNSYLAQ